MAKEISISIASDKAQRRFWAKVQKTDTCWLWTGKTNRDGYGAFKINRKEIVAHRFTFLLENGATPAGKTIRHNCKTRNCVNPSHLYLTVSSDHITVSRAERRARRYSVLGEDFCISNNLIPLSQGKYATVDDIDYEYLSQFNWHCRGEYAVRAVGPHGKQTFIKMHRVVLERKLGRKLAEGEIPDHVHGNPLNNTRQNLRPSTNKQNVRNRAKNKTNALSRFKGVSWNKYSNKWQSQIKIDGRYIHIGVFAKEEDAARAYDQTALLWFQEFARLNFPNELKLSEILVSNS